MDHENSSSSSLIPNWPIPQNHRSYQPEQHYKRHRRMSDDDMKYRRLAPLDFTSFHSSPSNSPFSMASFNQLLNAKTPLRQSNNFTPNSGLQDRDLNFDTYSLTSNEESQYRRVSSPLLLSPKSLPPVCSKNCSGLCYEPDHHSQETIQEASHDLYRSVSPETSAQSSSPVQGASFAQPVGAPAPEECLLEVQHPTTSKHDSQHDSEMELERSPSRETSVYTDQPTKENSPMSGSSAHGELRFVFEDPGASSNGQCVPAPQRSNLRVPSTRVKTRKAWDDKEKMILHHAVEQWKASHNSDSEEVNWDWVFAQSSKHPGFRRGKNGMLTMATKQYGRTSVRGKRKSASPSERKGKARSATE
ncbi:hypothetical protein FRC02_008743 [Tulasnella sp. 418]|nr:hypothetical protein FRC02_008743 [Tulasnella sp. 418]